MGIFSRLESLVRANVDDLISRSEDPERMLNQAILEMGYHLVEARKKVIVAIADEKRLRAQWEAEVKRAKAWKDKAMLAVRHGDDALAKEALLRRREHEELSAEFQRQWESQRRGVDQLKVALGQLNTKLGEARRKKNLLLAKQRRALAQQMIQETMSNLSQSSALATFERMEHRINQLEAEADATAEMADQLTGDTLALRIAQLESSSEVEIELLELKDEMGLLPSSTEERQLSSGDSGHADLRHEAVQIPVSVAAGNTSRWATS